MRSKNIFFLVFIFIIFSTLILRQKKQNLLKKSFKKTKLVEKINNFKEKYKEKSNFQIYESIKIFSDIIPDQMRFDTLKISKDVIVIEGKYKFQDNLIVFLNKLKEITLFRNFELKIPKQNNFIIKIIKN